MRPSSDAPSKPNVLVQVDGDRHGDRFIIAVADTPVFRNVHLSVRCRPVSGRVDQACGLVFRYQEQTSYLLARANALENNVRLYAVSSGYRHEIASWSGPIVAGAWHTLEVIAVGEQLDVSWDGQRVISARDESFLQPGRVGLWLKADSYTEFDDLIARPIVRDVRTP